MDFLISGTHMHPLYLIGVGFVVGILGGFFGVGGSFLAGPALFAAGMPMNFVVGTDLTHIVGKSIVAAKKHRALGNVDIKLGMIMVAGGFIFVLLSISAFIGWESWQTLKMLSKRGTRKSIAAGAALKKDAPLPPRLPRYIKPNRDETDQ